VKGLGLRRRHHSVVVVDTPENRGMINKAIHLLQVEEAK
jgi:large subunit ribosomal protein L30